MNNKYEKNNIFFNNTLEEFDINDNNQIIQNGYTDIGTFIILQEGKILYSGEGKTELTSKPLPGNALIYLILNGTDTNTYYNNKYILKTNKKTNTAEITTSNENFIIGTTTNLTANFYEGNTPINTGKVIFKINGKTLKDVYGKVLYANVVNGVAIKHTPYQKKPEQKNTL